MFTIDNEVGLTTRIILPMNVIGKKVQYKDSIERPKTPMDILKARMKVRKETIKDLRREYNKE